MYVNYTMFSNVLYNLRNLIEIDYINIFIINKIVRTRQMTKVDYVNIFIINEMVEDHSKVMNITKAIMESQEKL